MEDTMRYWHEVIYDEPRLHTVADWLCAMVIVFFGVYALAYATLYVRAEQGVTLPALIYTPDPQTSQPASPQIKSRQYPVEQT